METNETPQIVRIGYINHRGEIAIRRIIPKVFGFGRNDYHPEPQYLLDAYDVDKQAHRTFAMNNILFWNGTAHATLPQKPSQLPGALTENLRSLLP